MLLTQIIFTRKDNPVIHSGH